nr:JDVT-CTERM system glutamic-type intramembrane protease [Duganella sp. sic0402]
MTDCSASVLASPSSLFCGPALLQPDLATVLRLVLLAPLLEEWIMRAGLHAWLLQRTAPAPALLASALAFSALHLGSGLTAAALVFGPGLLFGAVYQRWQDWRRCALLHALCNAGALTVCGSVVAPYFALS